MLPYILRRVAAAVPVVWGVSTFVFLMIHLVPGDPVQLMYGNLPMSQADLDRIRTQLGLDQPLLVQYGQFFGRLLQGDLGRSIRSQQPVVNEIMLRLPYSVLLATLSTAAALVLGLLAGVIAATRRGRWLDTLTTAISVLGVSVPSFWLGLMLIFLFAVRLGWLPASGSGTPQHLVLPVLSLALLSSSIIARLTRSGMLDVLNMEYVTTARAKGLAEQAILYRHALKNALIPIITIVGLQFGTLLGGAFVVETVFAWPGVGRLAVQALSNRDYPIIQGVVLFVSLVVVLVNLATDVLYVAIDPRVRA
jgi:peptide/nickel transport system permease protein/oligopeptide transport system permease protein